jgi:serine/threonine protein kinase
MAVEVLKQVWPEWKIDGKPIGKGTFSVVYKAVRRDHGVESYAAIKVISIPNTPSELDSLRSDGLDMNATRTYLQGIVNDFVSEIQLMESLKGVQNIVSVEDYKVIEKTGEIGWDIFIRMELLTSFNTYICDQKLTEEEVIKLGCDICSALEICAKKNIIHRDIKPENILVHDFGYFKLGDFGIARKMENMTAGLSQKGSFHYMAPEVAHGMEYDARADIYSLGIVLYRLLNNNRLPFLDTQKSLLNLEERRNAVERRLRGEELPAPCNASPNMADIILRACAYDPNERFSSAAEMKQALIKIMNETYQMGLNSLDKTTSVRKTTDCYDKTASVQQLSATSNQKSSPTINTFGSVSKKKNKLPSMLVTVLVIALVAVIGIFAASKLSDENDRTDPREASSETTFETTDYAKFDEEQIASIISEAEALAAEEDYEGALAKVQTGLAIYPKSSELQDKADEYIKALNDQVKVATLDEAKTFADSEDYVSAIVLIKNALETQNDDADYKAALETYSNAYKTEVIASADDMVTQGNYDEAIALLKSAEDILGNDDMLTRKIDEINDSKPEYAELTSLKVVDSSYYYEQYEGMILDSYGNAYTNVGTFRECGTHFATYYTAGKYSTLYGTIAAPDSIGSDGVAVTVNIYADDKLIYTIPSITRTTKPIDIDLDIMGADTVKIEAVTTNVYPTGILFKLNVSTDAASSIPNYISTLDYGEQENIVDLKVVDSSHYYSVEDAAIMDTYGNTYSRAGTFSACGTHYAIYYTARKYTSLKGTIAAPDSIGGDGVAVTVNIYADDNLIYTVPSITRTTTPIDIALDITDADTVKIEAVTTNVYPTGILFKLDVLK